MYAGENAMRSGFFGLGCAALVWQPLVDKS